MKANKKLLILLCAVSALALTACGSKSYADGTYKAQSQEYVNDEDDSTAGNGYGVVELTISGGAITACDFKTYELDGTLKDAEYGKENGEIANKDFYNKAQKAVQGSAQYGQLLVEAGSPDGVDSISGATISYNEFLDAVSDALDKAQE